MECAEFNPSAAGSGGTEQEGGEMTVKRQYECDLRRAVLDKSRLLGDGTIIEKVYRHGSL